MKSTNRSLLSAANHRFTNGPITFKAIVFLIFALCLSCSTKGEQDQGGDGSWYVTVSGKVQNPQQGQIVIQELKEGASGWQDTVALKKGNVFSKRIKLTEPGYYRLNFFNKQMLNLILDKDDIQVNVDGSSQQGFVQISGSSDMDLIEKVNQLQAKVNDDPEVTKLNADFTVAARQGDQASMEALREKYMDHVKKYHDQIAALMVEHSPSLAVINLLQSNVLDKDQYYGTYEKVAATLKRDWSDYAVAQHFIDYVERMKLTAVGQPAPEIALPNPDGEIVKLSSMRGKYVLVDFWAKWCGPCRQENPNVVRAYQKYKDKGFTVFGVSLDRNRADWLQAIEQDNLTWTHVSDLKYWQSEAAKTYNITGIPFSLLLDPNGIIIAKNLRGAALHQKLAEIFDEK